LAISVIYTHRMSASPENRITDTYSQVLERSSILDVGEGRLQVLLFGRDLVNGSLGGGDLEHRHEF
jgi:hypothetical protein